MADKKTLGDYLKLMTQAEKQNDSEVVKDKEAHVNPYYDGPDRMDYDDEDSYDVLIKELGLEDEIDEEDMASEDEEETDEGEMEDEQQTIYSGYYVDDENYWDSKESFVKDLKEYMAQFDPKTITDHSPYPHYECEDYLILGVTIEKGLIVVVKCYDEDSNNKNLLFHIQDQPIFMHEIEQ